MIQSLANLSTGLQVLFCYLLWYLVVVAHYFEADLALWLNALGISLLIGSALVLSVGLSTVRQSSRWFTARLYLMPFFVSSFSALIKDHGFLLILPPGTNERLQCIGACAAFLLMVTAAKAVQRRARD